MEITKDIIAAAIVYARSGEYFTTSQEGGQPTKEIEGTLIGIVTGSDSYTLYLSAPALVGASLAKGSIVALQLSEEEARVVLTAVVGAIGSTSFPKYPRFSFRLPEYYRSIEVATFTPAPLGRLVSVLSPTDVTNKEVTSAAAKLITSALQREKYPLKK